MGFFKKLKKEVKRGVLGLSRRQWKNLRRHVGLTSKSKWVRQLKRSFSRGAVVSSYQPTSATDVGSGYRYNGRTISQLVGGP